MFADPTATDFACDAVERSIRKLELRHGFPGALEQRAQSVILRGYENALAGGRVGTRHHPHERADRLASVDRQGVVHNLTSEDGRETCKKEGHRVKTRTVGVSGLGVGGAGSGFRT